MEAEKKPLFFDKAREKILKGVESILDLTSYTYGPKGNNIKVISQEKTSCYSPKTSEILKDISLSDKHEKIGEHFSKNLVKGMEKSFDDGHCLALILFYHLIKEALSLLSKNPQLIQELQDAYAFVKKYLAEKKSLIKSEKGLADLLNFYLPENRSAALLLAELFQEIGCEGDILIEPCSSSQTFAQILPGVRLNLGYASSYFCDSKNKLLATLESPYVLLVDFPLNNVQLLSGIFKKVSKEKKSLLLIAPDYHPDVLATLSFNQLQKNLKLCPLIAPKEKLEKDHLFKCLSITCNTPIFKEAQRLNAKPAPYLGYLKKAYIHQNYSHLLFDDSHLALAYDELEHLEAQANKESEATQKNYSKKSIDFILSYLGILYISDQDSASKALKETTALVNSSLKNGVLIGGGLSLLRASQALEKSPIKETKGAVVLAKALKAPLYQLMENSGQKDPDKLLEKIENSAYEYGFNAQSDQIQDLVKSSILDPHALILKALELSVEGCTNILKIDALIC